MNQDAIDAFNAEKARKAEIQGQTDQVVGAVQGSNADLTKSIHDLALATYVGKDPRMVEVAKNLADLLEGISTSAAAFKDSKLQLLPYSNVKLAETIKALADGVASDKKEDKALFDNFLTELKRIADVQPVVNVPKTEVKVDLDPILKAIKALDKNVDFPDLDTSDIVSGLNSIKKSIDSQRFPVPNYVLPFKDSNGKAVQVQLDGSGNIPTTGGGGGAGTQYAELITTAPATGTVALGRYKSSPPVLTDGQLYAPQLDASGNLKVNIQAGAGSGGTAMVDDAAFTVGTTSVTPVAGTYKSTRDAVDDNDAGALAMNAKRGLYVSLETPNSDSAMDDTLDTVKVSQATAANLNATVVGTGTFAAQVTGTVTANGGTNLNTSALALAATQTDKSQFTKLTDGTDTALVTAAGEQNVIATAQPGVDIGDVTINNASGAAAVNIQDGGNSITVDNGGTFVVQATLAAETTKVIGTVNQGTSPWVTSNATTSVVGNGAAATAQRVTLANDSTGVIATVGAVTAITNALPAGTNGIGKLTANSGVTIGAVEIAAAQTLATVSTVTNVATIGTSVTPGTAATNLGKAEDAGHTSGDVGVMSLGVRNDAGTALATTTLDYIPFTTDEAGATWMATIGRVSTANSSTATLLAGAVFTGTGEEVKNYAAIQVSVISNVASATDGLSLQQSQDNTNWDFADVYTVAVATGKIFSVQPAARYFRVVYTNGGTNQASFRLQTVYHTEAPNPSSQRASDAYTNETDLTQLWAFNSVWNGTTWDRQPGDTTGAKVKQVASTANLTNVAASASSVTLLSANTARIGAQITNDSSAVVYIKFGTTASTTSYTVCLAGAGSAPFSYYEVPAGYTGRIDAIWASATGNARITEES